MGSFCKSKSVIFAIFAGQGTSLLVLHCLALLYSIHKMLNIILIILLSIIELAAGCIMFKKYRSSGDKALLILTIFFFFSSIGAVMKILLAGQGVSYTGERPLLKPTTIFIGFSIFFFLTLYPIEVMRPNWLNIRRILLILIPYLTFSGLYSVAALTGTHFIYSASEIFHNIDKTEVFLRLVLALLFIPYGLWVMLMGYNWKKSSAPLMWIRFIVFMIMLMTLTFSCSRLFQIKWTMYLHLILYLILTAVILWVEVKVRFQVPCANGITGSKQEDILPVPSTKDMMEALKERLQTIMDNPDIWQNPDLTRDDLCKLLGTNANYLQKAIKASGYQSYSDMINRIRVNYVCNELKSGSQDNIQDIFYRAGYRSRVTAWRNFTAITGASPASWSADPGNV